MQWIFKQLFGTVFFMLYRIEIFPLIKQQVLCDPCLMSIKQSLEKIGSNWIAKKSKERGDKLCTYSLIDHINDRNDKMPCFPSVNLTYPQTTVN